MTEYEKLKAEYKMVETLFNKTSTRLVDAEKRIEELQTGVETHLRTIETMADKIIKLEAEKKQVLLTLNKITEEANEGLDFYQTTAQGKFFRDIFILADKQLKALEDKKC